MFWHFCKPKQQKIKKLLFSIKCQGISSKAILQVEQEQQMSRSHEPQNYIKTLYSRKPTSTSNKTKGNKNGPSCPCGSDGWMNQCEWMSTMHDGTSSITIRRALEWVREGTTTQSNPRVASAGITRSASGAATTLAHLMLLRWLWWPLLVQDPWRRALTASFVTQFPSS